MAHSPSNTCFVHIDVWSSSRTRMKERSINRSFSRRSNQSTELSSQRQLSPIQPPFPTPPSKENRRRDRFGGGVPGLGVGPLSDEHDSAVGGGEVLGLRLVADSTQLRRVLLQNRRRS